MRLLNFGGEIPKIKPQALPQSGAQLAENVDLYGGLLRPHRNPRLLGDVVTEHGRPYIGNPAQMVRVGEMLVGMPREIHWVIDPRASAGSGTVLFVRDGRLWRLSPRMVREGTGPKPVGIYPPKEAPVTSLAPGQGCKSQWEAHACGEADPDCDPHADAPEVRGYRITYLNECQEESAPSPVSNLVDVKNGDGVTVIDRNTPPDNAVARRIYRSVTTTDGQAVWVYVAQTVIEDVVFIDDICPNALGEALMTEDHLPPTECADGIALAGNMRAIIWSNDQFWVSEPGLPHAYTPRTRIQLPYKIQLIGAYTPMVEGEWHFNTAIATTGYPYAADVKDDGQTAIRELEFWYPAVNPMGWTVFNGTVVYTAEAGLVSLHGTRVELITDQWMTEREWAQFQPDTVRLTGYDQRLFAWYTKPGGGRDGLLLVTEGMDKRREPSLTRLTLNVTNAVAGPDAGMVMLIGNGAYQWGTGTGRMRYRWWSRVEVNSARWFPTVFKVVGDEFPWLGRSAGRARLAYTIWKRKFCTLGPEEFFEANPQYRALQSQILSDGVDFEFTIYCDGTEFYHRRVGYANPVMMKRSRRGIEWSIMVEGTAEVRELHLQKSHNDLQNDGGHA